MGLQLPDELVSLLGWLGFSWPEADEEKMFEVGQTWLDLAAGLPQPLATATDAAGTVLGHNAGDAVSGFREAWQAGDSPAANLASAIRGAQRSGIAMMLCAGIILALKINVILQLALLAIQIAQAVATAAVTAGASLLEIPIFRIISKLIIDELISMAVATIFNG
ncbi:hypothetical protein ACI2K4_24115 [Micromonospora sp. NPDC050397]|uniref:WXG100-like domain-containing protein n=1 Tax=Micromonospora sp. NPDC050397 TaxID=3364279 RepID=UPI0038517D17